MGKNHKAGHRQRKSMSRAARLQSAKAMQWVSSYAGKNIVRGYRKWFGVDLLCAIAELRLLGVAIRAEREEGLRTAAADQAAARARRRKERDRKRQEEGEGWPEFPESDETFAHIAGYTPAGFSFGVTWEQIGETPPWTREDQSK